MNMYEKRKSTETTEAQLTKQIKNFLNLSIDQTSIVNNLVILH